MEVMRHFSRGRERYLVFVTNPFVADSDVVNVFSGNDATEEEFIALKNDSTAQDTFKEMSLPQGCGSDIFANSFRFHTYRFRFQTDSP